MFRVIMGFMRYVEALPTVLSSLVKEFLDIPRVKQCKVRIHNVTKVTVMN